MAKPLPTNEREITSGLLRAATALQVGVYEFRDSDVNDRSAMSALEATAKEIDRLVRALRKTL